MLLASAEHRYPQEGDSNNIIMQFDVDKIKCSWISKIKKYHELSKLINKLIFNNQETFELELCSLILISSIPNLLFLSFG